MIDIILKRVRKCVASDNYVVSIRSKDKNTDKNAVFLNSHRISHSMVGKILLEIAVDDFCHAKMGDSDPKYKDQALYVFAPKVDLDVPDGDRKTVTLYIKLRFEPLDEGNDEYMIVVSIHEFEFPVKYLFKV